MRGRVQGEVLLVPLISCSNEATSPLQIATMVVMTHCSDMSVARGRTPEIFSSHGQTAHWWKANDAYLRAHDRKITLLMKWAVIHFSIYALSGRRHSWIGSGHMYTRLTDKSLTSFSRHCSMVWQSPYLLVHAILISFITLSVTATGIRLDPKNPWCPMVFHGVSGHCVCLCYVWGVRMVVYCRTTRVEWQPEQLNTQGVVNTKF